MNTEILTIDQIIAAIKEMSSNEILDLNNRLCENMTYPDDFIYSNDEEFFELFYHGKGIEVARAIHFGNYNFSHDYVKFNGYGNLETFQYLDHDSLFDLVSTIAEYIFEDFSTYEDLF